MRLIAKVKCPGCKMGSTQIKFVAPGFMSFTQSSFTCEICESDVAVRFARKDNKNFKPMSLEEEKENKAGPQVQIGARITRASEKLIALLEEERREKEEQKEAVL